jgi:hypothetical protein
MPYEDFEDATLTSPVVITANPASKITIPSATQYKNGTHSMAMNLNSLAAEHYISLPLAVDNAIISWWFRTGAGYTAWSLGPLLATIEYTTGHFRIFEGYGTGDNVRHIQFFEAGVEWPVSDSTWYAIMFAFHRNTTCRCRLYDAAGTQVGAEATFVEPANDALVSVRLGQNLAAAWPTIIYFDSLTWDTSTLPWPMQPSDEGGGGPTVALGDIMARRRRIV